MTKQVLNMTIILLIVICFFLTICGFVGNVVELIPGALISISILVLSLVILNKDNK